MRKRTRAALLGALISVAVSLGSCTTAPSALQVTDQAKLEFLHGIEARTEANDRSAKLSLCLSGGGYRATLFSAGAVLALKDMGVLKHVEQISGVSGGAITAAWLKLHWQEVIADDDSKSSAQSTEFIDGLLRLTSKNIDYGLIIKGALSPWASTPLLLAEKLDSELFRNKTMQSTWGELPILTILATDMSSGFPFRANATHYVVPQNEAVAHHDVKGLPHGEIYDISQLPLAYAVAASAGFPPFFAPARWRLAGTKHSRTLLLGDGGIVDNLGVMACSSPNNKIFIDAERVETRERVTAYGNWFSTLNSTIDVMHRVQQDALVRANAKGFTKSLDRTLDQLLQRIATGSDEPASYLIALNPHSGRGGAYERHTLHMNILLGALAGENRKAKISANSNLSGLCVSIKTHLAKIKPDVQRGLIQWGYVSAWVAIDGYKSLQDNWIDVGRKQKAYEEAYYKRFEELLANPDRAPDLITFFDRWKVVESREDGLNSKLSSTSEKLTDDSPNSQVSDAKRRELIDELNWLNTEMGKVTQEKDDLMVEYDAELDKYLPYELPAADLFRTDPRFNPPFVNDDSCLFEPATFTNE